MEDYNPEDFEEEPSPEEEYPEEGPGGPSVSDRARDLKERGEGLKDKFGKKPTEKGVEGAGKKGAEEGAKKAGEKAAEKAAEKGAEVAGGALLGPEVTPVIKAAERIIPKGRGIKGFCIAFLVTISLGGSIVVPLALVILLSGFMGNTPAPATETPGDEYAPGELLTPPNLGSPDGRGYYKMPDAQNGEYIIYTCSQQSWGNLKLIQVLYTVAVQWKKTYPDREVIKIGDLNAGGGHASHKNGIDVDVVIPDGMMAKSPYNPQFAIDAAKLFFQTGLIKYIFYNDNSVNAAVNSWAAEQGLPGNMNWETGHEDHFHVRIEDDKGPTYAPLCRGAY